ncbi:YciE/YciF ferroxidase family protein [Bradyrhizobium sp. USDA 4486]
MKIENFKDMYIAELQELVSVERQLGDALKRMSEVAVHPILKRALEQHRKETVQQGQRVQEILQRHDADPLAHTDQAMEALIEETAKMMKMVTQDDLRDAALIASAQKLEHYEIAAYGSAAALAGQLDLRDDQAMLHESLEEEKLADRVLTTLAKSEVNQDALAA